MSQFILPIAERRTVVESYYIKSKKTSVRIVVGDPKDEEVALRFLSTIYSAQEPINVAAGIFMNFKNCKNAYKSEILVLSKFMIEDKIIFCF